MVLPRGEAEAFEPKHSERGYFLLQSQQYTSLSSADQEKCLCPQGHCLGDSGGNRVLCFDIITPIPFFGRQLSLFPADPVVLPVFAWCLQMVYRKQAYDFKWRKPNITLARIFQFTLTLHTCVEEKRARARQMWLRTGSDRSRRT